MRFSAVVVVALLVASGPAAAHHSFASEFDEKNCGEFTGTYVLIWKIRCQ